MKTTSSSVPSVAQDEITRRAREIWLERGSPEGQDLAIWLTAERELKAPAAAPGKADTKPARESHAAAETIDVGELQERLTRFGESPQRSPTSLDLS